MKTLQKFGGFAALYSGLALLVAMVGFLLVVDTLGVTDPIEKVTQLVDNQAFLHVLYLISYVIWGIVLVVLALALNERLKADSPAIMQTATSIGLIWACIVIASGQVTNMGMDTVINLYSTDPNQAAAVWMAIESVANGLGSAGGEILGGTWVLLVSWAALRGRELSSALNYAGIVVGMAGILSAIPVIGVLGVAIFGMGKIVWSLWLGIVLLRSDTSPAA
jgi:hypothetical protein